MNHPRPHTSSPECFDLEQLKSSIQEAVACRRALRLVDEPRRTLDWTAITISLRELDPLTDIGDKLPELPRLGVVRRWLGRLAARCVLFFTRFLTNRQRSYNRAVLGALHNLHDGLRRLEAANAAEIRALQETLARRTELKPETASRPLAA